MINSFFDAETKYMIVILGNNICASLPGPHMARSPTSASSLLYFFHCFIFIASPSAYSAGVSDVVWGYRSSSGGSDGHPDEASPY